MANILLTGGRAPVALELARLFHRAGHQVFMAESMRSHLSAPSRALKANFLVPPPRQQPGAYLEALRAIILDHGIELLIPTCEEIFYIAMGRRGLPCTVFSDSIEKLAVLHNKLSFVQTAREIGLPVPETTVIATAADLEPAYSRWPILVLKPVFSRFASRVLIRPTFQEALAVVTSDPGISWIAQEHLTGRQLCTYSTVHRGRLAAHTAYRCDFTAGQGAAIAFRHVDHEKAQAWVSRFAQATGFTGQLALDFIEGPAGDLRAIECNPRATSGIHLLAHEPGFVDAFFDGSGTCLVPGEDASSMLAAGMLIYGLPASLRQGELRGWLATFLSSRDVTWSWNDPKPFLLQYRGIMGCLRQARLRGIGILEASTCDIEWNGETFESEGVQQKVDSLVLF